MATKAWDWTSYDTARGVWAAGWIGRADIGAGDIESPIIPVPPGWYDIQMTFTRGIGNGEAELRLLCGTEHDQPTVMSEAKSMRIRGETGGASTVYTFTDGGFVRVMPSTPGVGDVAFPNGVNLPVGNLQVDLNNLTGTAGEGVDDFAITVRRLKSL